MNNKHKITRLSALAVVLLMLLVSLMPVFNVNSSEVFATQSSTGDNSYTYTLKYDIKAGTIETIGMTPIDVSKKSDGSWGWNDDGIGPFNSFYAAFDSSNGNKMICRLNPYDLSLSIDGDSIAGKGYNIMWVLPTVYWKTNTDGMVVLSNDSADGVAYAHTVDGKIYSYLAIGVYEGSINNGKLQSVSGSNPTVESFETFISSSSNLIENGKSMAWNYYQYELYRLCGLAVIGSFDSQESVGYGGDGTIGVIGLDKIVPSFTGQLDKIGPYGSNDGSGEKSGSEKLFIENTWTSMWEYISGLTLSGGRYHLSQQSTITKEQYENCDSTVFSDTNCNFVSSGWINSIYTNDTLWGMPSSVGVMGSGVSCDYVYNYGNSLLLVGGRSNLGLQCGINSINTAPFGSNSVATSRLALLFDYLPEYSYCIMKPNLDDNGLIKSSGLEVDIFGKGSELSNYWTYDQYGYGPFGSFYAAFDPSNYNRMVCHLDPDNLSRELGSNDDLPNIKNYNIMWVLPTIYWKTIDDTNNLLMTDDPNVRATALAHTIDGKVYNYLALGVYESSVKEGSEKNGGILGSYVGQSTVVVGKSLNGVDGYRKMVSRNTFDGTLGESKAMIWNLFQWELYRNICFASKSSFNIAGGFVGNNLSTGATNGSGPTIGNTPTGFKLFLENTSGSYWELLDNVFVTTEDGQATLYAGNNSIPNYEIDKNVKLFSIGANTDTRTWYRDSLSVDSLSWGLGIGSSSNTINDHYPYESRYMGTYSHLMVGGESDRSSIGTSISGAFTQTYSSSNTTTRVSFLFDVNPVSYGEGKTDGGSDYQWQIKDVNGFYTLSIGNTSDQITIGNNVPWVEQKPSVERISVGTNLVIGDYAFYGYKRLTEATFSNCNAIGIGSFSGTSFESISSSTVNGQSNSLILGNSLSSISQSAFEGCRQLKTVSLDSVEKIGKDAFKGCSALTSINVGYGCDIGESAFEGAGISSGFTFTSESTGPTSEPASVADYAFRSSTLKEATISNCSRFGVSAFEGCRSLTSITSPSTNIIEYSAFKGCIGLQSITIGDGCIIGDYAFEGAGNGTSFQVSASSIASVGMGSFKFSNVSSINLTSCSLYGPSAFEGCKKLISINLNGASSLSSTAVFKDCTSLTVVEIPERCKTLGESIFEGCTSLTQVTASGSLEIGKNAFLNCTNVKSITLPSSKNLTIGEGAFKNCGNSVVGEVDVGLLKTSLNQKFPK